VELYQYCNLAVSALTFLVLLCTLVKVGQYTEATREQVEALQRPFLTIEWQELRDGLMHAALKAVGKGEDQPIFLGIVPHDGLRIRNIGNGPALNIFYRLKRADTSEVIRLSARGIPHLPENGFQTAIELHELRELPESEFLIEYESLRGIHYETTAVIRKEELAGNDKFIVVSIQTRRIPENP
jgi:hypothetical protein